MLHLSINIITIDAIYEVRNMRLSVSVYIISYFLRYSGNIYSWWNSYKQTSDISNTIYTFLYGSVCWIQVYKFQLLSDFQKIHFCCGNSALRSLPLCRIIHPIVNNFTSMWLRMFFMILPNTALFINLNKFFSKPLFASVLNFVLSSM